MIIWINGTHGVGKTSVAIALKRLLGNKSFILDADAAFPTFAREKILKVGGGVFPQTNVNFMKEFKTDIIEYSKRNEIIIVPMTACTNESKDILIDYFRNKNFIHIILEAEDEKIKERIMNDLSRDKELSINEMKANEDFLKNNYPQNEFVDTSYLSIDEIANKIIQDNNLDVER